MAFLLPLLLFQAALFPGLCLPRPALGCHEQRAALVKEEEKGVALGVLCPVPRVLLSLTRSSSSGGFQFPLATQGEGQQVFTVRPFCPVPLRLSFFLRLTREGRGLGQWQQLAQGVNALLSG